MSNMSYSGSNNVYFKDGCPALMNDGGRSITYYGSSNELTEKMRKINQISSPNQFRTFMQTNGDLFMNSEREFVDRNNLCKANTACSEGYYNLWERNQGSWANQF